MAFVTAFLLPSAIFITEGNTGTRWWYVPTAVGAWVLIAIFGFRWVLRRTVRNVLLGVLVLVAEFAGFLLAVSLIAVGTGSG